MSSGVYTKEYIYTNYVFSNVNSDGKEWGYKEGSSTFKGPSQWKTIYVICNGQRQSPIDIAPKYIIFWSDLKPIIFTRTSTSNVLVAISKYPTTIYVAFNPTWKISFDEKGCLRPVALHWHWGSNNTVGSEHILNGEAFPIEGHLVNYNCELYSSFADAKGSPSGLHVIGFFYKIGKSNNALNKVVESIKSSSNKTNIVEIPPRDFLPEDLAKYYRYEGSLTTPPCTENVVWTVLRNVQDISESQLSAFRSLQFGYPENGPMVGNFRPTLPIHNPSDYVMRVVYSSFSHGQSMSVNFAILTALFLLAFSIISDNH